MGLRVFHLIVGVAGLIAFAATGQYMAWIHAGLQGMPDGPRLFFRSVQSFASLLILAGPFMLCASFFVEQHNRELLRPIGQLAIFVALGGALLHAVAALGGRMKSGAT